MTELRCDVLVAGGGPAGASLAGRLASSGASVVACEKARFPRDKLCGEFVSPDGIACLERLGVRRELDALGGRSIEEFLVTASGGGSLQGRLPAPALGVSRRALDDLLLRHARASGARVIEECRVVGVDADGSSMRAHCQHDDRAVLVVARCFVDATGRLGGPRRGSAATEPRVPAAIAVQEHRRAPPDWPSRVEIHAFDGGYAGLDAIEDGRVTTCVLASLDALERAGSPGGVLDLAAAENAAFRASRTRLGERIGEIRTTSVPRPRRAPPEGFALGDATGMIDPLCGNGIAIALRSAEMLAPILLAHLGGVPETVALTRWNAARERELRRRMSWGRALAGLLMRPAAARILVATGRAMPWLTERAVRATRGDAA